MTGDSERDRPDRGEIERDETELHDRGSERLADLAAVVATERLLRHQDRIADVLSRLRQDLESATTRGLVRAVPRPGDQETGLARVSSAMEEALRTLRSLRSELRRAVTEAAPEVRQRGEDTEGLPPFAARFFARRPPSHRLEWELLNDPVRGWVVLWKETLEDGSIRAAGRIHEHPYAWIDD
jgi:hypothetical protein